MQPGHIINATYRIEAPLGHGGMGEVYRATHLGLDKPVALKILARNTDQTSWRRFQIEAQAIARLDNPHIVRIMDMGLIDGTTPYYSMELLSGFTLQQALQDAPNKRLPIDTTITIFKQICLGLAYAHDRSIIHRDIKPANIMLEGRTAKIVDFGLAKFTGAQSASRAQLTQPGEIFGSPYYMSPEQFAGETVDHRTDLYSLGVALYQAVSGRLPFKGDNIIETSELVREAPTPPLPTDIPHRLQHLITTLLAKNPFDRPQSANEIFTSLNKIEQTLRDHSYEDGDDNPDLEQSETSSSTYGQTTSRGRFFIPTTIAICTCIGIAAGAIYFITNNLPRHDDKQQTVPDGPRSGITLKQIESGQVDWYYQSPRSSTMKVNEPMLVRFPDDYSLGFVAYGEKEIVARGPVKIPRGEGYRFKTTTAIAEHPRLLDGFRDSELISIEIEDSIVAKTDSTITPKEIARVLGKTRKEGFRPGSELIEHLKDIPNLLCITLKLPIDPTTDLRPLDRLDKLHLLVLDNTEIDGRQLAHLELFKRLENFCLTVCDSISIPIARCTDSRVLRVLDINYSPVTMQDIDNICKIKTIDTLRMGNCGLTGPMLAKIARMPRLKILTISADRLAPSDCLVLKDKPQLHELLIYETRAWSPADQEMVKQALPQATLSQSLTL